MKRFVLIERAWEYNDEYYFRPESGGGTPVHIFETRDAAEKEKTKLERKKVGFKDTIREGLEYAYGKDPGDLDCDIYEIVEVESD